MLRICFGRQMNGWGGRLATVVDESDYDREEACLLVRMVIACGWEGIRDREGASYDKANAISARLAKHRVVRT